MIDSRLSEGQKQALLYFARFATPVAAASFLKAPSVTALVAAGLLRAKAESRNLYALTEAGAARVSRLRKELQA